MNVLLSIGCNTYTHLNTLQGAEKDARDIFNLLVQQSPQYSAEPSQLLLSPSLAELRAAVDKALPTAQKIDVLTFFFSGHAGVKGGSLFLCLRDTDPERLSITAFPIVSFFTLVNEFQPNEVNIIVDACEAGGSSFDLAQLLKPEVIGFSGAPSITFLGACSSDQNASDGIDGSIMTRALVKCLSGEQEVQTYLPFLDLVQVGSGTRPCHWLFARNSRFARNPHFDADGIGRYFSVGNVSPLSDFGKIIRLKSPNLWDEYRLIKDSPNPRRLLNLLNDVLRDTGDDIHSWISFVHGLSGTMSARAGESSDSLASSHCLGTCAVSLLPQVDTKDVQAFVRGLLRTMLESDSAQWNELLHVIKTEKHALLGDISPAGELYYLPLRITKTLGWIGLSVILESLLPDLQPAIGTPHFELASEILERYRDSLVAVSDEQAAPLYVFIKACLLRNKRELAEQVANHYFASFAERRGNVTRIGTDGVGAFRYILSLGPEEFRPKDWRPANASLFLPVLLLSGAELGLGSVWDLRALDRKSSTFFIPSDYRQFGRAVIEQGMNYTHRIGFGIWTVADFKKEFDTAITTSFGPSGLNLPVEAVALCIIASLLFPDRIPLVLEQRSADGHAKLSLK